ncbi:hypothetical protein EOD39_6935 [Acipenser ruthenus]|uniref:Uncharacterized protein n=1 Tax=Acipenser ruthenus TaxID=7906 RepID=A0A444U8I2_ACIRT|nr:hypothetical protein EOD39_6935 [Acipenser ruthenus]
MKGASVPQGKIPKLPRVTKWENLNEYLDYLRLDEPFIGLQHVIEVDPLKYLCRLCFYEADMPSIALHLVGRKHRQKYLLTKKKNIAPVDQKGKGFLKAWQGKIRKSRWDTPEDHLSEPVGNFLDQLKALTGNVSSSNPASRTEFSRDGGYPEDDLRGRYPDNNLRGRYPEDDLRGRYPKDDLRGRYPDDNLRGRYPDDNLRGRYPDDNLRGRYPDDNLRGRYPEDDLRGRYPEDDLRGRYPEDDLRGRYPDDDLRGRYPDDDLRGSYGKEDLRGSYGKEDLRGRLPSGDDLGRRFLKDGFSGDSPGKRQLEDDQDRRRIPEGGLGRNKIFENLPGLKIRDYDSGRKLYDDDSQGRIPHNVPERQLVEGDGERRLSAGGWGRPLTQSGAGERLFEGDVGGRKLPAGYHADKMASRLHGDRPRGGYPENSPAAGFPEGGAGGRFPEGGLSRRPNADSLVRSYPEDPSTAAFPADGRSERTDFETFSNKRLRMDSMVPKQDEYLQDGYSRAQTAVVNPGDFLNSMTVKPGVPQPTIFKDYNHMKVDPGMPSRDGYQGNVNPHELNIQLEHEGMVSGGHLFYMGLHCAVSTFSRNLLWYWVGETLTLFYVNVMNYFFQLVEVILGATRSPLEGVLLIGHCIRFLQKGGLPTDPNTHSLPMGKILRMQEDSLTMGRFTNPLPLEGLFPFLELPPHTSHLLAIKRDMQHRGKD